MLLIHSFLLLFVEDEPGIEFGLHVVEVKNTELLQLRMVYLTFFAPGLLTLLHATDPLPFLLGRCYSLGEQFLLLSLLGGFLGLALVTLLDEVADCFIVAP